MRGEIYFKIFRPQFEPRNLWVYCNVSHWVKVDQLPYVQMKTAAAILKSNLSLLRELSYLCDTYLENLVIYECDLLCNVSPRKL